jgi:4-hydroxy-tetrahydrodipicolinate synthase
MKYRRKDAKAYAREHLRGIWAAALTPFTAELRLDYVGWRRNLRHWYRDLGIAGIFVNGKQGEFLRHDERGAKAHGPRRLSPRRRAG